MRLRAFVESILLPLRILTTIVIFILTQAYESVIITNNLYAAVFTYLDSLNVQDSIQNTFNSQSAPSLIFIWNLITPTNVYILSVIILIVFVWKINIL
jgi:hypothetical protein